MRRRHKERHNHMVMKRRDVNGIAIWKIRL